MVFIEYFFKFPESFRAMVSGLENIAPSTIARFTFDRSYARTIKTPEGHRLETWGECVLRSIEGNFSIRYDYYMKNNLEWDDEYWNEIGMKSVMSAYAMEWMPAGRQLWKSGINEVTKTGSL